MNEWYQKALIISKHIVMFAGKEGLFNVLNMKEDLWSLVKAIMICGLPINDDVTWMNRVWQQLVQYGFPRVLETQITATDECSIVRYSNLDQDHLDYEPELDNTQDIIEWKFGFSQLFEKIIHTLDLKMEDRYVDRHFRRVLYCIQLMLCDPSFGFMIYNLDIKEIIIYPSDMRIHGFSIEKYQQEGWIDYIDLILSSPLFPIILSETELDAITYAKFFFESNECKIFDLEPL